MPQPNPEPTTIHDQIRSVGVSLIGESTAFMTLLRSVERVAAHSSATVLLRGETGTGKELVARAIHYLGARRDFPFVPINCGALPDSLVENELFGHRPGAFTGAIRDTPGLVHLAHRGTLFLDEVDSLPAKAQVALLRLLQDGHFRPLGSAREQRADLRVVAASNRCLEDEIRAGRFRQDLFYRLNLIALEIPPLRARVGDAHVLAKHFLRQCSEHYKLPNRRLHEGTLAWFDEYSWPGNVRELENLLHRECLFCDGDELRIEAPGSLQRPPAALVPVGDDVPLTYHAAKSRALEAFDRKYLTDLIRRARGNVTKAAKLAGKERRAFGKLLKRYEIRRIVEHPDTAPR